MIQICGTQNWPDDSKANDITDITDVSKKGKDQ